MTKSGHKRESKFAVSVVTVLAAFGASAGCDDDTNRGPIECPATQPKDGDPCDTEEPCVYQRCSFDGTPTLEALCEKGVYRIGRTSCNPPFPMRDGGWPLDASFNDAASDASSVKDGS